MVVVATSPVPQLANDIETLLCNHYVMHCDESARALGIPVHITTNGSLPPTVPLHYVSLALSLLPSLSLSLSRSPSLALSCALSWNPTRVLDCLMYILAHHR